MKKFFEKHELLCCIGLIALYVITGFVGIAILLCVGYALYIHRFAKKQFRPDWRKLLCAKRKISFRPATREQEQSIALNGSVNIAETRITIGEWR